MALGSSSALTSPGRFCTPPGTVLPGVGKWPSTAVVWMTSKSVLAAASASRLAASVMSVMSVMSAVSDKATVIKTVTSPRSWNSCPHFGPVACWERATK